MEIIVRLLDEVIAKLNGLTDTLNNIDMVIANTANDVELCVKTLLALAKKLDALALVVAAPGPVSQSEASEPVKSAPAKRVRTPKAAPTTPTSVAADANREDHEDVDDEDALRARCEFEARRTTRQFGIGGTRAAIARVAGDGVLRVDDVPTARLAAVLSELQAM